MSSILMRAGLSPLQQLAPEVALEGFPSGSWGTNVGNFIFSDSIHRLLSTPDTSIATNAFLPERGPVSRRYVAQVNSEFDHFVVPLANAFRTSFLPNLQRLTDLIEKLHIPVTVIGVGVAGGKGSLESPVPKVTPQHAAEIKRFLNAVLTRSATIGVRGEYTAQFLKNLGYGDDVVRIIGCPSLFKFGPSHQVLKKVEELDKESPISLNLTHYVPAMGPISIHNYKQYPNLTYIPQVSSDAQMLMWGKGIPEKRSRQLPVHIQHPLYRADKMRFFTDSTSWTRYLAERDFTFGTRIHGNIAALISGTPAHVIAHDARTLELARYHAIPHTRVPDLGEIVDAHEFYEGSDFTEFNTRQAPNFELFSSFLEENGLGHVYQDGHENPAYDQAISQLPYVAPIRALTSRDPHAQRESYARIQAAMDAAFQSRVSSIARETYDFDAKGERRTTTLPLESTLVAVDVSTSPGGVQPTSSRDQKRRNVLRRLGLKLQRMADI